MVLPNTTLDPYGDHLFLARNDCEWTSLRRKYGDERVANIMMSEVRIRR